MACVLGYAEPLRILCVREFQTSISASFHAELKSAISTYPWLADHYDVGEADALPGVVVPAQVAADYQALRVPLVVGTPERHPRTTRNPARGLMDLSRAVVVALADVGGLRLGLCDFGARESSDIMHADLASKIPSGAE